MSIGLTNYLLTNKSDEGYILCTQQHSFLKAARERTLCKDLLALWLSQDRIYAAHAYPRFISGLISKIPFSSQYRLDSEEEKKNQRLLSVLTSCLENVVREAGFFMASAKKYDLDLSSWKERLATRSYTAEMARISTWGSLEEGLVFLWAMEKVCDLGRVDLTVLLATTRSTWMLGVSLPGEREGLTQKVRRSRALSMLLQKTGPAVTSSSSWTTYGSSLTASRLFQVRMRGHDRSWSGTESLNWRSIFGQKQKKYKSVEVDMLEKSAEDH